MSIAPGGGVEKWTFNPNPSGTIGEKAAGLWGVLASWGGSSLASWSALELSGRIGASAAPASAAALGH